MSLYLSDGLRVVFELYTAHADRLRSPYVLLSWSPDQKSRRNSRA